MHEEVFAVEAMRTRFELALPRPPECHLARNLAALAEEALHEVVLTDADLSAFRSDSLLSILNREAGRGSALAHPMLYELLEHIVRVGRCLGFAFDPTVGSLLECYRTGRTSAAELARARERVGFERNVKLSDGRRVEFLDSEVRLDLGGVGKGSAVARVRNVLRASGVESALIHGGTSSVLALGSRGGAPWRVGIAHPADDAECVAVAELTESALSVSVAQARGDEDGRVHVIDPRSLCPLQNGRLAAVVHPDPVLAEILSTALVVLGPPGLDRLHLVEPTAAALVADPLGRCGECGEGAALSIARSGEAFVHA
jgi:thiamine biosynthesis lipoprotein